MYTTTKNKKGAKNKKAFAIVGNQVCNYEKHPFFVKKANAAKALLKVVRLPRQLAKAK